MTKQFKRINNIVGWLIFLIASSVYLLTIEPTASFWDCGEFISTSYKLEVGHPPGAPLFMIISRVATLFAGGDITQAAKMMNSMSAIASSLTILFLFWTITHIARKVVSRGSTNSMLSLEQTIIIMGTGIIGALVYTFSDTFWFSAVEAEVYASSSFFTAVVFWAILKWEDDADNPHSSRWIILIAYLIGLSIGVHLLNLLTIPAIVFVYYYKKHTFSRKGFLVASICAIALTGFVMWVLIPGLIKLAFAFDLVFVNSFGLPYDSGVIFYLVLLLGSIFTGLVYTHRTHRTWLNTAILSVLMIIIGYSSYAAVVIRSSVNTPLDENNPENVFNLLSYINRDQYGDTPLLSGQCYNSPLDPQEPYVTSKKWYIEKDGKYVVADEVQQPNYDSRFNMLLPRMWSSEPNHVKAYKQWAHITGTPVSVTKDDGSTETIYKPTFAENLHFLFSYQLGHMYWRYFMWNFAGRQNDIQGNGEMTNGNWISGIPFIDSMRLGNQDTLPDELKNNKGRNVYFFLPFLLGLLGILYLYKRSKSYSFIVLLLFVFTGIAIVIFLNQYPYQPRERDYAYAGSFYAFCVWIGFGVLALYDFGRRYFNGKTCALLATSACMVVPVLMAAENWDDHDRSNRYIARDFATNYLNSCAPNAILFTNGDNDTFPLWYCQEVEGIRTDVRIVNLSLLNTDWYIDQMKRKAYTSAPVPFSLSKDQYVQGKCDVVYIIPDPRLEGKGSIDVKGVVDYIASDDPRTKYNNGGKLIDMIPCTELKMSVDSAKVFQSDVLCKGDEKRVVSEIHWKLDGSYIVKNHLMVLDLLSNNDWSRPIYFAITVGSDNYFGLSKYFRQEGLAYRLVPFETRSFDGQEGEINTDIMYKNMMEKFKWGGLNEEGIYLDEGILRMASNFRNLFGRLAQNLIIENKKDSARKVLERCEEVIPNKYIPYNYFNIYIAESFIQLGLVEKGKAIIQTLARSNEQNVKYYLSIPPEYLFDDQMIVQRELGIAHELLNVSGKYKFSDIEASVANNTLLSIEKNYKFVFNYMNFAQNQEQLGQWYETLDDFEKNILALYVQIQQTKQKNIK